MSAAEGSGPVRSSPIEAAIDEARARRRGAFVAYLPVGYPDLDTSVEAAVAVLEAGADVLELGLPYSDPVMDGPAIQAATAEALRRGFRVRDAFEAVRRIRAAVDRPVAIMSYWNLVLRFGVERFAETLAEAGGAGLITPDLVPDEAEQWLRASEATGLDRIFLAAPSSSDERLERIVRLSSGFVYTVSTMGVTGARERLDRSARQLAGRLHAHGAKRACVGIGVSTPQQVAEVLDYAEGAIVGSALVRRLAEGGVGAVRETAARLAEGTR